MEVDSTSGILCVSGGPSSIRRMCSNVTNRAFQGEIWHGNSSYYILFYYLGILISYSTSLWGTGVGATQRPQEGEKCGYPMSGMYTCYAYWGDERD